MHPQPEQENSEDVLNDALSFFGGPITAESDSMQYGPLVVTVAPKVRDPDPQTVSRSSSTNRKIAD